MYQVNFQFDILFVTYEVMIIYLFYFDFFIYSANLFS